MRHPKRAVYTIAITEFDLVLGRANILVVTPLTKVVGTIAKINSYVTAKEAFPIYVLCAVFLAENSTSSKSLYLAVLTQEIIFVYGFLHS